MNRRLIISLILSSFAILNPDPSLLKIDLGHFQTDQLACPHAGRIQHLEHRAIAQALGGRQIGRIEQGLDLGLAQGFGEWTAEARGLDLQYIEI